MNEQYNKLTFNNNLQLNFENFLKTQCTINNKETTDSQVLAIRRNY